MHIGLYGGSFDPIHLGHLKMAKEIMNIHHLDEVWFIPANISPHKLNDPPACPLDRLEMLKLAIADQPQFKIYDTEIYRNGPSYTIDTLQEIIATQSGKSNANHYYLILGDDSLSDFNKWKLPQEILRLVPLLVGRRNPNFKLSDFSQQPILMKAIERGWTPTSSLLDISSTYLRSSFKTGLDCSSLIPTKVLDYIKSHGLYCNPYEKTNR